MSESKNTGAPSQLTTLPLLSKYTVISPTYFKYADACTINTCFRECQQCRNQFSILILIYVIQIVCSKNVMNA